MSPFGIPDNFSRIGVSAVAGYRLSVTSLVFSEMLYSIIKNYNFSPFLPLGNALTHIKKMYHILARFAIIPAYLVELYNLFAAGFPVGTGRAAHLCLKQPVEVGKVAEAAGKRCSGNALPR